MDSVLKKLTHIKLSNYYSEDKERAKKPKCNFSSKGTFCPSKSYFAYPTGTILGLRDRMLLSFYLISTFE